MNKSELVGLIATKAGLTKKDVDVVLGATLEAIIEAVTSGERITLIGFGTFEPRDRKAREGRNPSNGKPLSIPARTVPAFAASQVFRAKMAPSVAVKATKTKGRTKAKAK